MSCPSTIRLRLPAEFGAICEDDGIGPDQVLQNLITYHCEMRRPPTKVLVDWHVDDQGCRARTIGSER
jgi:hypothetical protein